MLLTDFMVFRCEIAALREGRQAVDNITWLHDAKWADAVAVIDVVTEEENEKIRQSKKRMKEEFIFLRLNFKLHDKKHSFRGVLTYRNLTHRYYATNDPVLISAMYNKKK